MARWSLVGNGLRPLLKESGFDANQERIFSRFLFLGLQNYTCFKIFCGIFLQRTKSAYLVSSIYLFGKITQKSLRIALMKRLRTRFSNEALYRPTRVSSFLKDIIQWTSCSDTQNTQINAYADCSSLPASYPCQFNARRVSRAFLGLQNGVIFPCNHRKYCTKDGKIAMLGK